MKRSIKADLSLFGITVFWGASFPVMSVALKYIPPYCFISIRNILGSIIIGGIFYKRVRKINKAAVKPAVLIGVSLLLGNIFQIVGLLYTTPSKSGFITGLNAVFIPTIIALMYRKLPDRNTVIGIVLSVIGLGIMSISKESGLNFGDILTLLCALSFAIQIILVDKYSHSEGIDVIALTSLELFIVGILALVPAGIVERFKITLNSFSISSVIFTTVLCTALGMYVQNKMQPLTNPAHAGIIYLAEPVFAALTSIFVGDKLTGRTLVGCIIILIGMVTINIGTYSHSKAEVVEKFNKELNI